MTELLILDKPDRIFNADESGLQINPRDGHVVCEKGKKDVNSVSPKEKGEAVRVLAYIDANGKHMPPTSIFKGKRLHTACQGKRTSAW
jgi:hypothetical protein